MTTTTSPLPDGRIMISIKDPADLITAIPCLLGFRPTRSVIVLGIGGAGGVGGAGHGVRPVLRLDLPAPEHERDAAQRLAVLLARHPGSAAVLLVVGQRPEHPPHPGRPPHLRLVERFTDAFAGVGRKVAHALWTPEIREGQPWRCYDDLDCHGLLPDQRDTVTAAVMVSTGAVTFDSREELAAQLRPDDPAAVERCRPLLRTAMRGFDRTAGKKTVREERASAVRAALDRVRRSEAHFTDEEIVRLAQALADTQVRDACLTTAVPPGTEGSFVAERLWLELVRRTPEPERAAPATLLGYSAYQRGEGALANIAFDTALAADPDYLLAALLRRCLEHGLAPETLRHLGCVGEVGPLAVPRPEGRQETP